VGADIPDDVSGGVVVDGGIGIHGLYLKALAWDDDVVEVWDLFFDPGVVEMSVGPEGMFLFFSSY